jgi:Tol biopolymer transport system component
MLRWLALPLIMLVLGGGASAGASPTGTIVFAANRSPITYGEIYRYADGETTNLSRSPAQDFSPTVSPDGLHVAFVSNRGGRLALYVVGIDGVGLHRISPLYPSALGSAFDGEIAWSPDSKRVFAGFGPTVNIDTGTVWAGGLDGNGNVVGRSFLAKPAWSPDGTEIAYQPSGQTGGAEVDVVDPSNKLLWSRRGDVGAAFGWGKDGDLAVSYRGRTTVYDRSGRTLAAFPAGGAAWSPDGTELASLRGSRLQVRRGGVGSPFVDATVAAGTIQWLGNGRLRVLADDGSGDIGYDVAHNQPLKLPRPFAAWEFGSVASRSGTAVTDIALDTNGLTATLHVANWTGGDGPAIAKGAPCTEQPWWQDMAFTPHGDSLVYETGCGLPNADIYSIGADGGHLRRLTNTDADEMEPAWSPDGTRVAYAQRVTAWKCDGCAYTLWTMNADGSGRREITPPSDLTYAQHPSWSPDGKTLAFWSWTFNSEAIDTVPAAGGDPTTVVTGGAYPAWGPSRIAYINGNLVPTRVQTVDADGTGVQTVGADSNVISNTVAYSTRGRIAWLRADAKSRVYLVVAGKGPVMLPGLSNGQALTWSPDGTRLALAADDSSGVSDVWIVNADGTHLVRVTDGIGAVDGLSWKAG